MYFSCVRTCLCACNHTGVVMEYYILAVESYLNCTVLTYCIRNRLGLVCVLCSTCAVQTKQSALCSVESWCGVMRCVAVHCRVFTSCRSALCCGVFCYIK